MNDVNFNLKFVAIVEKFPVLYNSGLKAYTNDDAREQAWNEISHQVNLSASECKERWRNLRSVFVRHQKNAYINKNKKPYYLGEAMKFALPFIKTMGGHIEYFENKPHTTSSDLSPDLPEEEEEIPIFISYPSPTALDSLSQEDSEQMMPEPDFKVKIRKRARRTDVKFIDTNDAKFHTSSTSPQSTSTHDKKLFLLSLLPELEPLTEVQMRSFRRRVLELIDDIASS